MLLPLLLLLLPPLLLPVPNPLLAPATLCRARLELTACTLVA